MAPLPPLSRGDWPAEALAGLEANFLDERSSQWLYESLAALDRRPQRAEFLRHLAQIEDKHAQSWEEIMAGLGRAAPEAPPFHEHRFLVALARLFGVGAVLPAIHKSEVEGVAKYRAQAKAWKDPAAQKVFLEILPDEIVHEVDIFTEMRRGEGEHGGLRSAILGANDGLGSILALVAGVAGTGASSLAVLEVGGLGVIAGAVSMAASNYVSVRAEQDRVESQLGLEREALELAPETKRRQLHDAYVAKGLGDKEAEAFVAGLAHKPEAFLRALLEAQYGISSSNFENPARLAAYTGLAFAASGLVPLLPFALLGPRPALWSAVALSGAALFAAGMVRSLSTLKPFLRSGLEMLLVGMGSAGATYLLGSVFGGRLG